MAVLPGPGRAVDGKTRGIGTLTETFLRYVKEDSDIVSDLWPATKPAVDRAGLRMRGQVNHNIEFRAPESGYHTNDMESEWARFKLWYRQKYSYVRASNAGTVEEKREMLQVHVNEYVYYTNVGSDTGSIMKAFVHANGVRFDAAGV